MMLIIAGSRHLAVSDERLNNYARILRRVFGQPITAVLCGGARGIDECGKQWAEKNKIPVEMHPAKWEKEGKAAGFIRNELMVRRASALLAIWDGRSAGTHNMIELARRHNLLVMVVRDKVFQVVPPRPNGGRRHLVY